MANPQPRSRRLVLGAQRSIPVLALLFSGASTAAEPDEILEALRAADRARQAEATERQAWLEEKARLELVLESMRDEAAALRRRRAEARAALREARAEAPPPPEAVLAALESGAELIAQRIDDALDELSETVAPGVVPDRSSAGGEPSETLDRALHRLERAERAARSIDVIVATGVLHGEPRSVELVRLGGVAAWWQSLDGELGGEAEMRGGRLVLVPSDSSGALAAIRRAIAIAKGRRAPEVVLLPISRARTSTEGAR